MEAESPKAEPPPAPSAEAKYQRVWIWQETSDCLWKMAKDHYGDPFLWPKIYEANRAQIKDPAVIFPKQQIIIPPLEGVTAAPAAVEPPAAEPPLEIPAWLLEPEPAAETPAADEPPAQ